MEMVKPLRDRIPLRKYKGGGPLQWDPATSKPSNTANKPSPTAKNSTSLKTPGLPSCSKTHIGAQLNWSTREKECYDIYFGSTGQFEDLLDNRHFILKTDHMNLTYLNVTLTGKVLRWKLYLQDKDFHLCQVPGKEVHQRIPDALSRLCENNMPSLPSTVGQLAFLQLVLDISLHSSVEIEQPPQTGNTFILVLIDAFSRWVELFPTKTTTALESESCILQHFGRFGTPEVVRTDRDAAFHNELITELLRVAGTEQSLTTAYSKEENAIVERANKEVLRHLNALLFDARVHDKWSYEQLPMVQRIMNTVEKTSTGVTPAELILNNAIRLQARILAPPTSLESAQQIALSDTMDEWISKQHTLITVARETQLASDAHALVEYDPRITEYPVHSYVFFTPPVGRSNKLLPRHRGPYQVMEKTDSIYVIEDLVSGKRTTTHIHNLRPFNYDPAYTSPLVVAQHNE